MIPTGRRSDQRGAGFRRLDLRAAWSISETIADADVIIDTVPDRSTTAERIVLRDGGVT